MSSKFWAIAGAAVLTSSMAQPSEAQVPFLQELPLESFRNFKTSSNNEVISGCVYLDGRCIFQVAARRPNLSERLEEIQPRLNRISREYLQDASSKLQVRINQDGKLPELYINQERLLTVTQLDADLQGITLNQRAQRLKDVLEEELKRAQQERKPEFLKRQGAIAVGTGVAMLLLSWGVHQRQSHLKRSKQRLEPTEATATHPVTAQLTQRQEWNVKEAQHRLLQLAQAGIWGSGTFFILGIFPYTRGIQGLILSVLKIPLQIGLVGLGTYVVIRLSYALIDRFTSALVKGTLLAPEASQRLQLRISTVSGIAKGVVTISWIGVASLIALMMLGINTAPLLAGAGLIGVAVSLASQSLIKDALNGFFILLEDQYAVGDVITVGNVGGLVENMNLRITQLRDAEGRLITVPNSEIKTVANLSSHWSRADLSIPVTYNADVNHALALINSVAQEMQSEPKWQAQILDTPEVLGVDDFGNRGVIIRVWIKTIPLKQWDVAREFRRRIKVALDEAGISIPLPQQEIWFKQSLPEKSSVDALKKVENGANKGELA